MESVTQINKLKMILLMLFSSVFTLTFSYIWMNIFIKPNNYFVDMSNWLVLIGSIILFTGLIIIDRGLKRIRQKKYLIFITFINLMIIIGLQCFFVAYFRVNPTWDFGHVYYSALELKDEFVGLQPYFYVQFPNNIPALLVFICFFRFLDFFGVEQYLNWFIFLNMLVIILSIVCLYFFIYRRTNIQHATLVSFLMVVMTPLYTYTTIVYTDTLTIIFPILSLLIYDLFYHSKNTVWKYGWILLLGIILAGGTLIKANVIITCVAILIHYVMTRHWKSSLVFLIALMLPFGITNVTYQKVIEPILPVEKSEMGYPSTHWLMMGLNHQGKVYGGFNITDVHITARLKSSGLSKEEISKENLRIIKERLEEYGVSGYLSFLNKKINYTWGDGTYYAPDKLNRSPLAENMYQKYVFGGQKEFYIYGAQMVHLLVMGIIVVAAISLLKDYTNFNLVLSITLFGVFLFLLFWETRSRYLVLYVPIILALASHGLFQLTALFNNKELQKG